jgi:hypothetical protein
MNKVISSLLIFCLSITAYGNETFIFSQYNNSTMNCGIKPIPRIGHRIGRCINGSWEQVSTGASSTMNCGIKPIPRIGHRIGRCINGSWEQVSK